MTIELEFAQAAASATLNRTELQRFPSPVAGWELVQSLAEIPEGSLPGGIAIRVPKSVTSCRTT
jgi:hypothetical protein